MAKKLIIANWKMNPSSPAEAAILARNIEKGVQRTPGLEIVIAPPFPFLLPVASALRKSKLGAQDMFWEKRAPEPAKFRRVCSKTFASAIASWDIPNAEPSARRMK